MDSPISKDLYRSPFLREVLLDSTNGGPKRKGRSTGRTGDTGDTVQPRRTLCQYVSDDGIAAALRTSPFLIQ